MLTEAKSEIKEGNLNSANKKLKKIPSKFKYKDTKASMLKKKLKAKSNWVALCGKWKSTGGNMRVVQVWDYDGRWSDWHRKIIAGEEYITVRCSLLNSGKVKVHISGSIPCYTSYSSISAGLETGTVSVSTTKIMSGMGTIRIDKYTTLTLSQSGISVNYYKVNPNESQNFTYKYSTSMTCRKRVEKY